MRHGKSCLSKQIIWRFILFKIKLCYIWIPCLRSCSSVCTHQNLTLPQKSDCLTLTNTSIDLIFLLWVVILKSAVKLHVHLAWFLNSTQIIMILCGFDDDASCFNLINLSWQIITIGFVVSTDKFVLDLLVVRHRHLRQMIGSSLLLLLLFIWFATVIVVSSWKSIHFILLLNHWNCLVRLRSLLFW